MKAVELIGSRAEWRRLPTAMREGVRQCGVQTLESLWRSIGNDAPVSMPPIWIEPYGWTDPDNVAVRYACATPRKVEDSTLFGVEVPASSVLILDDIRTLRRVLVHEFSHCFWWLSRVYRAISDGKTGIFDDLGIRTDNEKHINPLDWFGRRDADEFLWYDTPEGGCEELAPFSYAFHEKWLKKGLPVKVSELDFSVTEISIPDDVIRHIDKLGLV